MTPGSVIRAIGPFGPRVINGYVDTRFSHHGQALQDHEKEVFNQYFYQVRRFSSEITDQTNLILVTITSLSNRSWPLQEVASLHLGIYWVRREGMMKEDDDKLKTL